MIKHKETEVVIIGSGWTGGIIAAELSKHHIPVVMLERGHYRDTSDWQHRDELRYAVRGNIFQDYSVETVSLRHNLKERALPIRYLGNWLPGTDLEAPASTGTGRRGAGPTTTSRSVPRRSTVTGRRSSPRT